MQPDGIELPSARGFFEDFFNNWAVNTALPRRAEPFKPTVDVLEKDNKIFIRCELPGVEEKDLDLRLDGMTLIIKGVRNRPLESDGTVYHQAESAYGIFSRSFELPNSADTAQISASFRDGVLTVTIPQKPETQPRTITVNA